jgi:hypothetical protein
MLKALLPSSILATWPAHLSIIITIINNNNVDMDRIMRFLYVGEKHMAGLRSEMSAWGIVLTWSYEK